MFTGIIEEIGTITEINQKSNASTLKIAAKRILSDVALGDSISVNGICLTVTSFSSSHFTVDVMPETLKSTSFRSLKNGSRVNLERAMTPNRRFGGHFVTGHVDGVGKIIAKRPIGNAVYYEISVPKDLLKYIILKGSVAVDGISLTVFALSNQSFTISLIPHTLKKTILGGKKTGELVNIECDMLGKYVERFIQLKDKNDSAITKAFLDENGFT